MVLTRGKSIFLEKLVYYIDLKNSLDGFLNKNVSNLKNLTLQNEKFQQIKT